MGWQALLAKIDSARNHVNRFPMAYYKTVGSSPQEHLPRSLLGICLQTQQITPRPGVSTASIVQPAPSLTGDSNSSSVQPAPGPHSISRVARTVIGAIVVTQSDMRLVVRLSH
jgi:hypothetical protein